MKKWTTVALATLMGLTAACTSNSVSAPEQKSEGIAFRTFADNSLRAAEWNLSDVETNGFTVYAFGPGATAYISGATVKPEGTGSLWATEGAVYPWPGYALDFYGYTNLGDYGSASLSKKSKTLTLKTPAEVAKQTDVLVAVTSGSTAEQHQAIGVPMNFKHLLSQIEVRAKNSNATYKVKVAGVKIGRINSESTFTFPSSTAQGSELTGLSTATDPMTFGAGAGQAIDLTANAQSIMNTANGNFMLLPQELTAWDQKGHYNNGQGNGTDNNGVYLSVLVNITTAADAELYPVHAGQYAFAATPLTIDGGFKAGNKYIITLDFSDGVGYQDPDKTAGIPSDGVTVTVDENPVGTGNDKPGKPILNNKPIKFTVTVEDFNSVDKEVKMSEKPTTPAQP